MINAKSFEELWETSESLYKSDITSQSSIIDELMAKLLLYKAINENKELQDEERAQLKYHMMGKVLSSLTNLSYKDNINVFAALHETTASLKMEKLENVFKNKS